jgi:hypothetical protein
LCFSFLRNGLSFNKETGTISGAPIVAADPVTYVITAYGFYFFDDTATVISADCDDWTQHNTKSI